MRILTPLLVCLLATPVAAQSVEVSAGGALPVADAALPTYATQYRPLFDFPQGIDGTAGQTFSLDRAWRVGWWTGVAWFPVGPVGVEARLGHRAAALAGRSGPYTTRVTYVSRQPPDYLPRTFTHDEVRACPDPEGTLRAVSVDLTVVGRLRRGRSLEVRPSAGLALVGVRGDIQPVGLTRYALGGHSVLFSEHSEARLATSRRWVGAVVTGVELHRSMHVRAGLIAAVRVVLPRSVDLETRVVEVTSGLRELTVSDAQQMLQPPNLQAGIGAVELVVGLRLR